MNMATKIFDRAVEFAKSSMESDGTLPPMLMAYTEESVIVIPLLRVVGPQGDMTLADLIKIYFLAQGVESYVLMHEAMLRHEPAGGKPRRLEAVMVVEVSRDGQSISVHEVKRDQGKPWLEPYSLKKGELSGKLTSLLPPDDFTAEDALVEIAESVVLSMGCRKLPRMYA